MTITLFYTFYSLGIGVMFIAQLGREVPDRHVNGLVDR